MEIGNENGNHKYGTLPFPSKASDFAVNGDAGFYSITFTGNLAPRCDTGFYYTRLIPVKTVKNEVVSAKPDLTVGNHTVNLLATFICEYDSGMDTGSFGRITGSAKGTFGIQYMISFGNKFINADSVSGLGTLVLFGSTMSVQGNVTVKELRCVEGGLKLEGTLTTDAIYQQSGTVCAIMHNADKPIVVKGITRTVSDENGNPIKIKDSVMLTDLSGYVYDNGNASIGVYTVTEDGSTLPVGTKVVTGNYLDPRDWYFGDGNSDSAYTHYKSGNALCIGELGN